jgi:protoheme IX farnesyltransferase
MSTTTDIECDDDDAAREARTGVASDLGALIKARLSLLVLATAAAGFVLAEPAAVDWPRFGWTMLGTFLAAGSAAALNQAIEVRRDALMHRTARRPIPAGRVSLIAAVVVGAALGYAGCCVLAMQVNLQSAALAAATILLYVAVYTPMKWMTSLNTLVGAVVGALPPMIGWAAATGGLQRGAWVLGAILFVWQLPHFFALAWIYRLDYRRGGFIMLPAIAGSEHLAARTSLLSALTLVPLGLMATLFGLAGLVSAAVAAASGLAFAFAALRHMQRLDDASARRLFFASLLYLPVVLGTMVADRGPVAAGAAVQGGRAVLLDLPRSADDSSPRRAPAAPPPRGAP